MAKQVFTNGYIAINGTALSDHASSITVDDNAEEIDFTSFSANGYREIGAGLKDGTVSATFFQDFAAASVHSILQPLYASGGTFAVEVRPVNTTVSSTNPKLTFTARLYSYAGIAGGVGEALTMDVSFRNAGTAGLTWGTT
jgi:hypothetical protein